MMAAGFLLSAILLIAIVVIVYLIAVEDGE